jgi:hypothetical protein
LIIGSIDPRAFTFGLLRLGVADPEDVAWLSRFSSHKQRLMFGRQFQP